MEEITRHANRPIVAIIGAGNVATHLAIALAQSADMVQIVSRHDDTARRLAERVGPRCSHSGNIDDLMAEADFYIIAAHDDAIAEIAESTPDYPGIWAHTSGSVSAEVFSGKKSRFGVFYPLQTFSRELEVDVRKIPFFIEGNSDESALALRALALRIADNVMNADSERRRLLHVAAVFACNFANLMWMEADTLLRRDGLDIRFLMPLIETTLNKLHSLPPREAMTGPARRGDAEVIQRHETMLDGRTREIYSLLSDTILETYHSPLSASSTSATSVTQATSATSTTPDSTK